MTYSLVAASCAALGSMRCKFVSIDLERCMALRPNMHRAIAKLSAAADPDLVWALVWCGRIGVPFVLAGAILAAVPIAWLMW